MDGEFLMTRRSRLWKWAAGFYVFINGAGLTFALAQDEGMHAMMHLVLLLLGAAGYVGWLLARRAMPQNQPRDQVDEERIQYLQQSVDAMALELERVGEAQRFADKLRIERGETLPPKKEQL
jgi:hypothetical protein